ncbi:MAG: hypothetical protein P0Y64_03985 [Candidatus Sphingomonas colombiensis]|nr:hypothetical protein [Sphingomonas sp.]WEK43999.1 MAG: hypothetical protein P0Y64_03985 [Sphingomonas sp.]
MTQSLKTFAGYRADLPMAVFAGTPFVPEHVDLGSFSLVSWVRNGLAAAITDPPVNLRAAVSVSFDVTGTPPPATPPYPVQTQTVSRTLTMRGPGDVIGIDQAQIVRRFPAPNVSLGDDSSLALIEFNRPDLPWLHSPDPAAGDRLKPWITLVVCDVANAELSSGTGGLPDKLSTLRGELQGLDDAWAWAHAQVLGASNDRNAIADHMGDAHADANLSRLICPRRLSVHTSYIACVVPTFDCGVKAGLGLPGGTLDPAWTTTNPAAEITLPVYASWRFTIGESYNFEELARRLVPVDAPWQIGRRAVDLRTPHGGVSDDDVSPGGVQYLKCALVSPFDPSGNAVLPEAEWSAARTEELRARIEVDQDDPDLPRVGPRLYARFQRGSTTVPGDAATISPQSDWFNAINLRPLDRVVAGLGTRVIQNDQDKLMQAAWLQVGKIREANAAIDRIRLARYVAEALVSKTLAKLPMAALTATTRAVHGKIGMPAGQQTVWANIAGSALPQTAAGMAFRRSLVSGAPVRAAIRGASLATRGNIASMIAGGAKLRDMRLDYAAPAAIGPITAGIAATLPADRLGKALGVSADTAAKTLVRRFSKAGGLAAQIATPRTQWRVIDAASSDAVTSMQKQRMAMLDAATKRVAALSPGRIEALGAQYATLAQQAPSLSTIAEKQIAVLDRSLGKVSIPILHGITPMIAPGAATPIGRAPLAAAPTIRTLGATRPTIGRPVAMPATDTVALSGIDRYRNFGDILIPRPPVAKVMTNAALADGVAALVAGVGIRQMPATPVLAAPSVDRGTLLKSLDPGPAARKAIIARLKALPDWLPNDWFDDLRVRPIMAAPRFDRPMWGALADWNQDWLIPNLGLVDESDFVTLLFDNPRFTESYLVGLSDEMGRELLWRGFPTDQRGTYFWRMWSEGSDDLKQQIARFAAGPLGSHLAGGNNSRVVMLIRGAVVKRHPEALFVAVRRDAASGNFADPPTSGTGSILFHAALSVDTILVGFDLTRDDIKQGNWWFLLAEHPGAPRFGLDIPDGVTPVPLPASATISIDGLTWGQLPMGGGCLNAGTGGATAVTKDDGNFQWATSSADVARILFQNPARAAFEAKAMMPQDH